MKESVLLARLNDYTCKKLFFSLWVFHTKLTCFFFVVVVVVVVVVCFVFQWKLSDSKFPQFSWNHLSILAELSRAVVQMSLIIPPITNSSSLFSKPLKGTVSSTTTTIGISATLIFHKFFSKFQVFVFPFVFFYFYSVVPRNGKIHQMKSLFVSS